MGFDQVLFIVYPQPNAAAPASHSTAVAYLSPALSPHRPLVRPLYTVKSMHLASSVSTQGLTQLLLHDVFPSSFWYSPTSQLLQDV